MNEQKLDELLPRALREAARQELLDSTMLPCPQSAQRSRAKMLDDPEKWRAARLRPVWLKVLRAAACLALTCALSLAALYTVSPTAYAQFIRWVETIDDTCTTFFGLGEPFEKELPRYCIGQLPEGAQLVEEDYRRKSANLVYRVDDEWLYFDYMELNSGNALSIKTDELECERLLVNGCTGYYYYSDDPRITSELLWIDETESIMFSIGYGKDQQTLLEIAESVVVNE